jgi:hypothetical protein
VIFRPDIKSAYIGTSSKEKLGFNLMTNENTFLVIKLTFHQCDQIVLCTLGTVLKIKEKAKCFGPLSFTLEIVNSF